MSLDWNFKLKNEPLNSNFSILANNILAMYNLEKFDIQHSENVVTGRIHMMTSGPFLSIINMTVREIEVINELKNSNILVKFKFSKFWIPLVLASFPFYFSEQKIIALLISVIPSLILYLFTRLHLHSDRKRIAIEVSKFDIP
jgi:hypothetical protein